MKTAVLDRIQTTRANTGAPTGLGRFVSRRADQVLGKNEFETGGMGAVVKSAPGQLSKYDPNLVTNNQEPLTGQDKDGRLKDLQGFSQRDNDKDTTLYDTQRCGATSLTAAAYHANGAKGLLQLMDASAAYQKAHGGFEEDDDYKALRAKVESGLLTKGQLSEVADRVHAGLQRADQAGGDRQGAGVSQGGMSTFLNSPQASGLKGTLDSNGTTIEPVDVQDKGKFNHWVARLGTGHGSPAIYDPESIKGPDGKLNQVTEDAAAVARYTNSSKQVRVP